MTGLATSSGPTLLDKLRALAYDMKIYEDGSRTAVAANRAVMTLAGLLPQIIAQIDAKDSALTFASAAIGDAIYTDDGLDGETGRRVQHIIEEARLHGTFDKAVIGSIELPAATLQAIARRHRRSKGAHMTLYHQAADMLERYGRVDGVMHCEVSMLIAELRAAAAIGASK